jgi:transcriptional regulator with XRE-family HTH domain
MSQDAQDNEAAATPDSEISSFGTWVRDNRIKQSRSVSELAKSARIAIATLHGIENGKFQNPQDATKRKLEKALKLTAPPPPPPPSPVAGIGPLEDFNPHVKNKWPKRPGVYVFYDKNERPIYVGQSADISTRLSHHFGMFWFKYPIVAKVSFVEVKDTTVRKQLESALIRFMKNSLVINEQGVKSSA